MGEHDGSREIPVAQRRAGVAAILAAGLLRHCRMARKAVTPSLEESSVSSRNRLELPGASRPPVAAGAGGYQPGEPEKGRRR
jgi:hypothetical protein